MDLDWMNGYIKEESKENEETGSVQKGEAGTIRGEGKDSSWVE